VSVRRGGALVALALLGGCVDRALTAPGSQTPAPDALPVARCTVVVASRSLTCSDAHGAEPALASAASADRIIGGQDTYVRLTSSGTAYDSGTEILSSNVTVQNLAQNVLGTPDGVAVQGVRVFFHNQPTTTSGTGSVDILNEDGSGTFTSTGQPYFEYVQTLAPYEISTSKTWQFSVPSTVTRFQFAVYVSAPMVDESSSLLDRVWAGLTDGDWSTPSNWASGVAPVASSTVAIPADSMLAPLHSQPALSAPTSVANLRVGFASALALNAQTLTVSGNVDVIGSITGGRLDLTGASSRVGGTVDGLRITGGATMQRAVKATSAVSVEDGSITASDRVLSITIP
jgi:hypothetical protein